jgi:23S rRNA (guanosine2251-2'-O)-methyltransferase
VSGPPVACGIHAVRVLLSKNPRRVRRVLIGTRGEARRLDEIRALAERAGIAVTSADEPLLEREAQGARHQGVVAELTAEASDPETRLEEALERGGGPPLILVLDGVQDPHNLGACLRSADGAGVAAVIVPRDRAAGMTPVVRKVAAGAADTVPLVSVVNLARTLRELRERGLWLVGTAGDAPTALYDADLRGPVALVLGSESDGLRRLTRETCDQLVSIPMAGAVESLNVSVTAGIVLFEAVRQRRLDGGRGPAPGRGAAPSGLRR